MTDTTPTPTTTADGLRALADWLDQHPDAAAEFPRLEATAYADDSPEGLRFWAKAFGNAEKVYDGELFRLRRTFGANVTLNALFWRSTVCRKVVTGTVEIPEEHIPARIIPARVEETVEWICDDPILAVTP